jgi:acyl-CoA hydrolase
VLPLVAYADGHDCASTGPAEIVGQPAELFLGWMPQRTPWLDDDTVVGSTVMAGYALSELVRDGRVRYVPVRLSTVPRLLAARQPDCVVISGVRRGDGVAFGRSVGWAMAAAEHARQVVVEIDDEADDLGAPLIPGRIARIITRQRRLTVPAGTKPTQADRAIAERVLSLLPARPTLQFGPGALAEAIVRALDRPVGVWSGLLNDAVAALADRGLLDGVATGAYVYGGPRVVGLCRDGGARLERVEVTHAPTHLAQIPRFVALNTALQVGLDGSVNVERVGGRLVAGIGGHPDFCAAAARSSDGLSVIALRSTIKGVSTIVPRVETVSTPRCDVDVVVTEHGVADLRGADEGERAARLASIAHPTHRRALER